MVPMNEAVGGILTGFGIVLIVSGVVGVIRAARRR